MKLRKEFVGGVMLSILLTAACSGKKEKQIVEGVEVETIKADAKLTDTIPSECSYILLDERVEAQMKWIDKAQIASDGTLWILASGIRQYKLVNFTADGKWIKTFDKLGEGPDEYLNITDFEITSDGDIWILDGRLDDMKIYDREGKLIRKLKPGFEADMFHVLDNGHILFGLSSWDEKYGKEWKVILADNSAQPIKYMIPTDGLFDPRIILGHSGFSVMDDGRIVYNREIDDRIYVFDRNGVPESVTELDFGKYKVPDEDKTNIMDNPNFDDYRLIVNRVGLVDNNFAGTLMVNKRLTEFLMNDSVALIKPIDEELKSIGFINDMMVQPLVTENPENVVLPDSVLRHLSKEGQVLRLVKFK